jgi:hypothetical protein
LRIEDPWQQVLADGERPAQQQAPAILSDVLVVEPRPAP